MSDIASECKGLRKKELFLPNLQQRGLAAVHAHWRQQPWRRWWRQRQRSHFAENQDLWRMPKLFLGYLGKIRNFTFSLCSYLLPPNIKRRCNMDSEKSYFLKGLIFSPCQTELSNTTGGVSPTHLHWTACAEGGGTCPCEQLRLFKDVL